MWRSTTVAPASRGGTGDGQRRRMPRGSNSALISSANLTEYALNLNMELGLLVRGGDLPGRVVGHLRRLMREGVLVPV